MSLLKETIQAKLTNAQAVLQLLMADLAVVESKIDQEAQAFIDQAQQVIDVAKRYLA